MIETLGKIATIKHKQFKFTVFISGHFKTKVIYMKEMVCYNDYRWTLGFNVWWSLWLLLAKQQITRITLHLSADLPPLLVMYCTEVKGSNPVHNLT